LHFSQFTPSGSSLSFPLHLGHVSLVSMSAATFCESVLLSFEGRDERRKDDDTGAGEGGSVYEDDTDADSESL